MKLLKNIALDPVSDWVRWAIVIAATAVMTLAKATAQITDWPDLVLYALTFAVLFTIAFSHFDQWRSKLKNQTIPQIANTLRTWTDGTAYSVRIVSTEPQMAYLRITNNDVLINVFVRKMDESVIVEISLGMRLGEALMRAQATFTDEDKKRFAWIMARELLRARVEVDLDINDRNEIQGILVHKDVSVRQLMHPEDFLSYLFEVQTAYKLSTASVQYYAPPRKAVEASSRGKLQDGVV